ncbi:hypothetical protein MPTK1_2g25910 [Marchantia polymorpha subsp. ruderalis]
MANTWPLSVRSRIRPHTPAPSRLEYSKPKKSRETSSILLSCQRILREQFVRRHIPVTLFYLSSHGIPRPSLIIRFQTPYLNELLRSFNSRPLKPELRAHTASQPGHGSLGSRVCSLIAKYTDLQIKVKDCRRGVSYQLANP